MSKDSPKDLDYYMANPDEMPTDSASLAQMMGDTGAGDEPETDEDDEQEEAASATSGADEIEGEDEAPAQAAQDDVADAPVSSKDGKHTIPYAVLDTERKRRQAAEQVQKELQDRIAELQSRVERGGAPTDQASETQPVADMLSDADLEELVTDFPSVKKLIDYTRALEGKVGQLAGRFQQIEQEEQFRLADQQQTAAKEVRDVVDANPALRYWEQHDAERWEAAIEADSRLQSLPVNRGLTLEQRFEKAVKIVETIYGPTELPEGYAPKATPKVSNTNVAEQAEQIVEKVGRFKPRTLSDMPGGAAPASDPLEDFASQSAERLGAQMADMSPDQINALLARLG